MPFNLAASLQKRIYAKAFGSQKARTEELAADVDSVLTGETGFLDRAARLFDLRAGLARSPRADEQSLRGKNVNESLGLLAISVVSVFGALFSSMTLGAAVLSLPAICCGAFFAASAVSLILMQKQQNALSAVTRDIRATAATTTTRIDEAVAGLQKTLDQQAPGVREQFNAAYRQSTLRQALAGRGLTRVQEDAIVIAAANAKDPESFAAGVAVAGMRR